jgi:hypothetical protein
MIDIDKLNEQPIADIITALLEMLHRDDYEQGSAKWFHWSNGNSPYELALDAITEKFGIEYDIEWNAPPAKGFRSVKVRQLPPVLSVEQRLEVLEAKAAVS